jgi:hypothetical protein
MRTPYEQMQQMEQSRRQLAEKGEVDPEGIVDVLVGQAKDLESAREEPAAPRPDARQSLSPKSGSAPRGDETLIAATEFTAGAATEIEATAVLRMSRVPAAHAHALEPSAYPLITFELQNNSGRNVRLRVTSFIEGYTAKAVDTVELSASDPATKVNQLPTFFPEKLETVHDPTRATLNVEIESLNGEGTRIEGHQTFRVWILPATTAVLKQRDPDSGELLDMTPYLVSWVTPNAPAVMEVLREASESTEQKRIVGYQVDEAGVQEQVQSIFQALKNRAIFYVNSVVAVGAPDAYVQRVRLPVQSVGERSANCIDGAVLYASLMEAASLQPGIVLIPGHAFVAWRKQRGGEWDFLETTMTASHTFADAVAVGRLTEKKYPQRTILDVTALRAEGHVPLQ